MKRLAALVADRTVALVGNAMSLVDGDARGTEIDGHDVVIRMNAGLPGVLPRNIVGERTDVWATAKHFGKRIDPEPTLMVFMKLTKLGNRDWAQFLLDDYRDYPMVRWPQELEDEVKEFVGADPGTGIRMLYYLKRIAHPKSVSLFGMDCWTTPSSWSEKFHTPNHDPELERDAVARLIGS